MKVELQINVTNIPNKFMPEIHAYLEEIKPLMADLSPNQPQIELKSFGTHHAIDSGFSFILTLHFTDTDSGAQHIRREVLLKLFDLLGLFPSLSAGPDSG